MNRTPDKCTATTSRGRCKRFPTRGTTVCATHGASARQVRNAAAERLLDQQVRGTLAKLGVDPVDDPLTALGQLAGQVLALRDALGQMVNRLESIRYEDKRGGEQLRAEVAVYLSALGECRQVLVAMARLDIDNRLARIGERQADAVLAAVNAGLAWAGVREPQVLTEARRVVARELRVLARQERGDDDV